MLTRMKVQVQIVINSDQLYGLVSCGKFNSSLCEVSLHVSGAVGHLASLGPVYYLKKFWLHHTACEILVLRPGIEPRTS